MYRLRRVTVNSPPFGILLIHWKVESLVVRATIFILPFLLLAACGDRSNRAPAIAVAYAGPATLNVRKDIPLQSPVVGTARHGDRLEIIQHRRRFIKVRTPKGIEGWTDEHLLLSEQEIGTLRAFEKDVLAMPSQGVATTYEVLNVHTEPDRQSPSFIQIKENEKFDVIAHRLAPRAAPQRKSLVPAPVKKVPAKKKPRTSAKIALPPMPPPPAPPADWQEISKTPPEIQPVKAEPKEPAPIAMEDWSLVRTAKGESGWVLTRRLFMAIPDEVAQYAEGHRISSYFPLGEGIKDEDKVRRNWLWTTIGQSTAGYDFDSLRVFIWSLRRHRYETAHIERNLKGYFPVRLEQVAYGAPAKTRKGETVSNTYPGFSVCVEKKDGTRARRSYAFLTNIVRFAGERPCEQAAIENPKVPIDSYVAQVERQDANNPNRSFIERFKGRIGDLRKRWFGK
jgi:hypothetical protein